MKKIGKALVLLGSVLNLISPLAFAGIQAQVDRNQITQEESVSLKISASGDSNGTLNPKFDAPDFEIMNQFENSQYSSVYVNGKFENKSEKSITYILRPLKLGTLKIRNISNNGEKLPDINIQVAQDTGMNKRQLPGDAPSLEGDAKNFFVKAEISKPRAYKGEQLVVSFYMYRRTRANLRDVLQYPSFQGFIREDLEMPILSGRPDFEAVSLGGIPFERALLARYAIYPIKEGKLKIDGFSIRADYIPKNRANDDMMEDPFFQFFSQVTPRTGTSKSDPITIEVLPLPEDGKSAQFSGGVGDFEVNSTLDSAPIKTNAPLTLHVSVKGKGNTSLIEFPKVNWPSEIKFYESQGKSKNLGQGTTEKTFDVVLVPQKTGIYTLPSIDFEFYSPSNKSYVHQKTTPLKIEVQQGEASAAPTLPDLKTDDGIAANENSKDNSGNHWGSIKVKENPKNEIATSFLGQPWWRWVLWFGFLMLLAFGGLVFYDQARKRSLMQLDLMKRKHNIDSFWNGLLHEAQNLKLANASPNQYSSIYEKLVDQIHKTLSETFPIASRALPQRELAKILTENHQFSAETIKELNKIFDASEALRFASNAGMTQEQDFSEATASSIELARKLCSEISSKKLNN